MHSYVQGEMCAALLDHCKSAFGVEGASEGFFSSYILETFEIKPVHPLIASVA